MNDSSALEIAFKQAKKDNYLLREVLHDKSKSNKSCFSLRIGSVVEINGVESTHIGHGWFKEGIENADP